jgi:hypothetical protein
MRQQIIDSLRAFAHQRPGLEYCNYGEPVSYRAEVRAIGKDPQQARQLLRYVELRASITADDIINASKSAYSGRLTIGADATIDYCTGQYWPTEYRRAVCAVLSSAIWTWHRDQCMPAPTLHHNRETGETLQRYKGLRAGDYLRASLKREFGRGIASRWFN